MTTVPTIGLDIRFGFDAAGAGPAALQLLTGGGWPPTQPRQSDVRKFRTGAFSKREPGSERARSSDGRARDF